MRITPPFFTMYSLRVAMKGNRGNEVIPKTGSLSWNSTVNRFLLRTRDYAKRES